MSTAIIFAGGEGRRYAEQDLGRSQDPKQFQEVGGKPIIIHTLTHFQEHTQVTGIYVACIAGWETVLAQQAQECGITKLRQIVEGGPTSQDSIYNALLLASQESDPQEFVLIHDGVRPMISGALITSLLETAAQHGNAIACRPCDETPLISRNGHYAEEFGVRSVAYVAQAPQVFRMGEILQAHEQVRLTNPGYHDVVDSATLMGHLGYRVHLVVGPHNNLKITYPEDVDFFEGWYSVHTDSPKR